MDKNLAIALISEAIVAIVIAVVARRIAAAEVASREAAKAAAGAARAAAATRGDILRAIAGLRSEMKKGKPKPTREGT